MPARTTAKPERISVMQDQMIGMISKKVTPTPGVGDQVVNEVMDVMDTAKETAQTVFDNMPVFVSRVLMAIAVIVVGLILTKVIKLIIRAVIGGRIKDNPAQRRRTAGFIASSIFGYVMYFAIIAVVLYLFGFNIESIFTAVGVAGIAISFGAQTLVKDIISGLFIWGEGNLKVGDLIGVNDLTGTVESMTVRTTTIRSWNGNLHVIPNGDIRAITNMSRGFKRAVVNVPCPYDWVHEDLVAIIREEMEIAGEEIEGINEPPEVMSIVSFENNCVMVQIAAACPVGEHWRIERDIRTRIKARFDREGIIMPHYTAPEEKK
jgi:small conductance mechanosensitive channel